MGRIAAANVDIAVDAPGTTKILHNLAVKVGYNAIRLWLNWGPTSTHDYTLSPQDWRIIGWEGWESTTYTKRSVLAYENDQNNPKVVQRVTIATVGQQVMNILNTCQQLGMGVILTGDFFSSAGGRLWTDQPADTDDSPTDSFGLRLKEATTAAGLGGDLGLFWQKTLAHFGGHEALIGIDLLNEPYPAGRLSWANTRSRVRVDNGQTHWDTWPLLAQYLVATARAADPSVAANATLPRIPYIIEGAGDAGLNPFINHSNPADTSFLVRDYTAGNTPNPSISTDRIIYSSHCYEPMSFSTQGVHDWSYFALGTLYPSSGKVRTWVNGNGANAAVAWNFQTRAGWNAVFGPELALKALGMPVFIGEFAAVQPRLEMVYPPSTVRASRHQSVSTVNALDSGVDVSQAIAHRQITQIGYDATAQEFTFHFDNVGDNFQPTGAFDTTLTLGPSPSLTLDAEGYPLDANGRMEASEWRIDWFINRSLKATVNLVGSNGKPVFPSVFTDVQIELVGGQKYFTVKASAIPSVVPANVIRNRGAADAQGKYPAVALLTLAPLWDQVFVETSRTAYTRDVLRLCQDHGFSWAYFSEDIDQDWTFVGWRATPYIRDLLSRAARGELVDPI